MTDYPAYRPLPHGLITLRSEVPHASVNVHLSSLFSIADEFLPGVYPGQNASPEIISPEALSDEAPCIVSAPVPNRTIDNDGFIPIFLNILLEFPGSYSTGKH